VFAAESGDQPVIARARAAVSAFRDAEGRAPSLMVAKLGQDGHDRGQKVVSTGFKDFGFQVEVGPLFQTPAEAAKMAVERNVHAVGASSLAGAHLTVAPALKAELERLGRADIMVVVGGVIPPADIQPLLDTGVAAVYPPGTVVAEAALDLLSKLNEQLGYTQTASPPA
jgi:methylmalonyl-CoA mutase